MLLVLLLGLAAQPAPSVEPGAAPDDAVEATPTDTAPTDTAPTATAPTEEAAPDEAAPPPSPPAAPAPPAAAGAVHEQQCTLAVLDLEGGDAMSAARARALSDVVTGEVGALSSCAVLSRSDIRGILTLEAEKQLMGCASDSCMAELAGALGADLLVTGTVSRIEGSVLLSLRMTDMKTLKVARRATDSFAGDDADAIPFVAWLSRKLMSDDPAVVGTRPAATARVAVTQATVWRPLFWTSFGLLLASGAVTAVAGAGTAVMSAAAKDSTSAASQLQDIGPTTADVANAALWSTGAFALTTGVLFFFPGEEPATP